MSASSAPLLGSRILLRQAMTGSLGEAAPQRIPMDASRGNYYESRTVTWALLRWIGEVTKD
jgi:hypothetical protein